MEVKIKERIREIAEVIKNNMVTEVKTRNQVMRVYYSRRDGDLFIDYHTDGIKSLRKLRKTDLHIHTFFLDEKMTKPEIKNLIYEKFFNLHFGRISKEDYARLYNENMKT